MKGLASLFIIFTIVITAVIFSFLFFRRPADVQASELFTLYFEIDPARQESAKIFAEIMHNKTDPATIGREEKIGETPLTRPTAELTRILKENRVKVKNALVSADSKAFSNSDVASLHSGVKKFYQDLGDFEDFVISGLDKVNNDQEYRDFIDTFLETSHRWQDILDEDRELGESLRDLAVFYEQKFEGESYAELFSRQLAILEEPVLSKDFGVVEDNFVIEDPIESQATLSFSFSNQVVDKAKIELVHPSGKVINLPPSDIETQKELIKRSQSFRENISNSSVVIVLSPKDPEISPIKGRWKYRVTAPAGSNLTFGIVHL